MSEARSLRVLVISFTCHDDVDGRTSLISTFSIDLFTSLTAFSSFFSSGFAANELHACACGWLDGGREAEKAAVAACGCLAVSVRGVEPGTEPDCMREVGPTRVVALRGGYPPFVGSAAAATEARVEVPLKEDWLVSRRPRDPGRLLGPPGVAICENSRAS